MKLEKKMFSEAIEDFNKALFLRPQGFSARFIDSLALAYYLSGDMGRAIQEYERITSLTIGRDAAGDIYAKSFYRLGKIYEQQGNTAKAIENYAKFLEIWKNADPGVAEVEDAKKRLAGLKN